MRLREVGTGVVVSVDDARGETMLGPLWERADKPADDPKAADKPRRGRPRKTD